MAEAQGNIFIALLEIVLLLLSQTSTTAVDYELEGVLKELDMVNVCTHTRIILIEAIPFRQTPLIMMKVQHSRRRHQR